MTGVVSRGTVLKIAIKHWTTLPGYGKRFMSAFGVIIIIGQAY